MERKLRKRRVAVDCYLVMSVYLVELVVTDTDLLHIIRLDLHCLFAYNFFQPKVENKEYSKMLICLFICKICK